MSERAAAAGAGPLDLRLVLVTPDDRPAPVLAALLEAALRGGVTAVLWRERRTGGAAARAAAADALGRAREHGAAFLVSRDVELAQELGADGVHTGWGGPSIAALAARAPALRRGRSAHWPLVPDDTAADYVTLSPFAPTPRSRPRPLLERAQVEAVLGTPGIGPVVALGGLTAPQVPGLPAGLAGVAVVRALSHAADPRRAAAELRAAVDAHLVPRAPRRAAAPSPPARPAGRP